MAKPIQVKTESPVMRTTFFITGYKFSKTERSLHQEILERISFASPDLYHNIFENIWIGVHSFEEATVKFQIESENTIKSQKWYEDFKKHSLSGRNIEFLKVESDLFNNFSKFNNKDDVNDKI